MVNVECEGNGYISIIMLFVRRVEYQVQQVICFVEYIINNGFGFQVGCFGSNFESYLVFIICDIFYCKVFYGCFCFQVGVECMIKV